TEATVDGHSGQLIVKRNHGGKDGLTVKEVFDEPDKYLAAVTIMFKRETGYDADNQDWFWAKYNAEGELDKNPKGMLLAGRVAKGGNQGCIACHTALGGKDMITLTSE
ncbi:MAG: cytochrome P460 family protein, partial [Thiolinea sp.]